MWISSSSSQSLFRHRSGSLPCHGAMAVRRWRCDGRLCGCGTRVRYADQPEAGGQMRTYAAMRLGYVQEAGTLRPVQRSCGTLWRLRVSTGGGMRSSAERQFGRVACSSLFSLSAQHCRTSISETRSWCCAIWHARSVGSAPMYKTRTAPNLVLRLLFTDPIRVTSLSTLPASAPSHPRSPRAAVECSPRPRAAHAARCGRARHYFKVLSKFSLNRHFWPLPMLQMTSAASPRRSQTNSDVTDPRPPPATPSPHGRH